MQIRIYLQFLPDSRQILEGLPRNKYPVSDPSGLNYNEINRNFRKLTFHICVHTLPSRSPIQNKGFSSELILANICSIFKP